MEALQPFLSIGALVLYLLPTMIAAIGNKRATGWIFLLNFLLGWTVLGWIGAIVWAVLDTPAPRPVSVPESPPVPPQAPATEPEQPAATSPGDVLELGANYIVRVGREITARSTGELRKGTRVRILHSDGDWVWVKAEDGQEGWIALKH
jgi:hypothetical protein